MAPTRAKLFEVSPVPRGERPLPTRPLQACFGELLACDAPHQQVLCHPPGQSLLMAAHIAFQHHFPLVLSPAVLWQTMLQGVSRYVVQEPETYRSRLVTFPGKMSLAVRQDEVHWPEVLADFIGQMRPMLTPAGRSLLPDFESTTLDERLAAGVTLMETTGAFFDYELHTLCGIPLIKLLGSEADWQRLAQGTKTLVELGLEPWARTMDPLLREFANAARGQINRTFWQNLYKIGTDSSGSPFFNGWIMAFFPFITCEFTEEQRPNPMLGEDLSHYFCEPLCSDREQGAWGFSHSQMPDGLARAEVLWKFPGSSATLQLVAGCLGVEQDPVTLSVRPRISWAVQAREAALPPNDQEIRRFFRSNCLYHPARSRPLSELDSL